LQQGHYSLHEIEGLPGRELNVGETRHPRGRQKPTRPTSEKKAGPV